ncbi:hypothetical protein KEU06_03865 [Pseudaminobacter sp. 19-2017]|uniref:Uncharacterized protein n=1 Tax=Pseudaminobacter soli (ex Zhang et al. 2022) TaxID=2831468 RepID=A0A942I240_9HYPH|nr:hypothetical protein [Pseudaminobacter soli]MBS3647764.1 hypothetical protein [Pseudaminobacter soli]
MAPARFAQAVTRRSIVQVLLAVPALALFRQHAAPAPQERPDELVEVNGWILKRSELA